MPVSARSKTAAAAAAAAAAGAPRASSHIQPGTVPVFQYFISRRCWVLLVGTVFATLPNDRHGRDVCVSRLGLPILLVQAQPVRPSREEQTYQKLVSGQRPCVSQNTPVPSRLTAPGWSVRSHRRRRRLYVRSTHRLQRVCTFSLFAQSERALRATGVCSVHEKQALCEKAVSGSAGEH